MTGDQDAPRVLTPQDWVKPCPACGMDVVTYQPPASARAKTAPKPVLFEVDPTPSGTWALSVYAGKLTAGEFNRSQVTAARAQGKVFHERHVNYCRYGERKPR